MYSLWFLLAILHAVTLYAVWRMGRSGSRKLRGSVPFAPPLPAHISSAAESTTKWTRSMKWISIGKFVAVLTKCRDLIEAGLKPDAQWVSIPVPAAFGLLVSLNEWESGLAWLAADRTAAVCGASNFCISRIETRPCSEDSAPVYVLEDEFNLAEGA